MGSLGNREMRGVRLTNQLMATPKTSLGMTPGVERRELGQRSTFVKRHSCFSLQSKRVLSAECERAECFECGSREWWGLICLSTQH